LETTEAERLHRIEARRLVRLGQRGAVQRLLVRPADAALMLDISRSKLYELLLSGELRFVEIGRGRLKRIPLQALEALAK
jgi:excisionase family DNA binding protein